MRVCEGRGVDCSSPRQASPACMRAYASGCEDGCGWVQASMGVEKLKSLADLPRMRGGVGAHMRLPAPALACVRIYNPPDL